MTRSWWAECMGTGMLLITVVGSGLMAADLSGGNQALALLANSLATGLMLAVLITLLAPLSGAHFNPAVTLSLKVSGVGGSPTVWSHVSAQTVGAIGGVLIAHLMWSLPPLQWAQQERWGVGLWFSELVASAGLVFVIVAGARRNPTQVPWLVGAYITAAYWFTASTSFANPAVTVARALTDSFTGIAPASVWPFVVAQFTGATAGAFAAKTLFAVAPAVGGSPPMQSASGR